VIRDGERGARLGEGHSETLRREAYEEKTSARYALSFAMRGRVLTNLVCASP